MLLQALAALSKALDAEGELLSIQTNHTGVNVDWAGPDLNELWIVVIGGVSRVPGLNIHAGIKRSLISLQKPCIAEKGLDGLAADLPWAVVHSVPSFSKDAGSTNNFIVPCVQVPIKQYITPKHFVYDAVIIE
jgi:hypothetical protein